MRFVLGVDEAGRGPLAGPVSVGVVKFPEGFDVAKEFPGVKDSKQISEKKREAIFEMLEARVAFGDARYVVSLTDASRIDREGIAPVIREAIAKSIYALDADPKFAHIYLDGSLKAPSEFRQETVIDGDALIPIISLASIAAKVVRDRHMLELAETYPGYGFEKHKGYGTKAHYEALKALGPCLIHRLTYLHI
jgi:ribonuclease HII